MGTQQVSLSVLFENFVDEARAAIAVEGASAELSVTGKLDRFLTDALALISQRELNLVQQTMTDEAAVGFKGYPDFRVNVGTELLGWVEFKAVRDKNIAKLTTKHDTQQKDAFTSGLHNLIYTNGWQWELWQGSAKVTSVHFHPDLFTSDEKQLTQANLIEELEHLLKQFTAFQLHPYRTVHQSVSALALRAKAMKIALNKVGSNKAGSYLNELHKDFKDLLYRNGQSFKWENFVDSYVQISAFGALLWRLEAEEEISLDQQVGLQQGNHPLLYQCLTILWQKDAQVETLTPLLEELVRTINLIPLDLFEPKQTDDKRQYVLDPIIHAYEPFFQAYDEKSREAAGVYYTPAQVVQHIVSGVNNMLQESMGRPDGLLDEQARFLDPATGTGTFLLGLAKEVEIAAEKEGLPTDRVIYEVLTERTSAFELFPGPYTIAHQRLEAMLRTQGTPPESRLPIYLTDTLAGPEVDSLFTSAFGIAGQEIANERRTADWLKTEEDILVIVGNPPYERIKKAEGGWDKFTHTLMQEVTNATPENRRKDLKSATDLFVAFWAWSLWALQDSETRRKPLPEINTTEAHGIVAFITNRTWIVGPSLVGLRSLVLKGVKEVWVYDLGGDNRGGSKDFLEGDQNVFSIQTGVAIVWLVFDREFEGDPEVYYRRSWGKKKAKLTDLAQPFSRDDYQRIENQSTFTPGVYPDALLEAPELPDLFNYTWFTGIQSARDTKDYSPLGIEKADVYDEVKHVKGQDRSKATLVGNLGRWAKDLTEAQRRAAWSTAASTRANKKLPLPGELTPKKVKKIQYRPLDERHIYNDPVWVDWFREDLQAIYDIGDTPTLISLPRDFGKGPLATYTEILPEQHAFNGRGGKAVFPLYKLGASGREIGLTDEVMGWAERVFDDSGEAAAEKAFSYMLALLSAPSYADQYWMILEASPPSVPLTEDSGLAQRAVEVGDALRVAWRKEADREGIRWSGSGGGELGKARWVDGNIQFDNGRWISGVSEDVWNFTISTYKVTQKWFEARQHWSNLSLGQSMDAQKTLASVREILRLMPQADELLAEVLGSTTTAPVVAAGE